MKIQNNVTIKKLEYFNQDFDLSGTIEDLFVSVRNGYVSKSDQIKWILEQACNELNYKIKTPCTVTPSIIEDLNFYLEDSLIREDTPDVLYSIGQIKLDLKNKLNIEDIALSDSITLSINRENNSVIFFFVDNSEDVYLEGGTSVPLTTVLNMGQYDFRNLLNNIYFYEVRTCDMEQEI